MHFLFDVVTLRTTVNNEGRLISFLNNVSDNVSDALFSITLFTPSDSVGHCNSEDLVTVFEAITA